MRSTVNSGTLVTPDRNFEVTERPDASRAVVEALDANVARQGST